MRCAVRRTCSNHSLKGQDRQNPFHCLGLHGGAHVIERGGVEMRGGGKTLVYQMLAHAKLQHAVAKIRERGGADLSNVLHRVSSLAGLVF